MQFITRLNVFIGIVVLLAIGSKALIAQQYFVPQSPVYGYAPDHTFAQPYGAYPSPGYANGFYEQGYSYPVLPANVHPQYGWGQVVPAETYVPPATEVISGSESGSETNAQPDESELTEGETGEGETDQSELAESNKSEGDSGQTAWSDQQQNPAPETKPDGLEALKNKFLGLMPSMSLSKSNSDHSPDTDDRVPDPTPVQPSQPSAPTTELSDSIPPAVEPEIKPAELEGEAYKSTPIVSNTPAPQTKPEPLSELLKIQTSIDAVVPRLLPAVVAIEGGSGVIVSSQGHILTASHVTKKAGRVISVQLADGRSVQATTLGTNVNSDTAAIKLIGNGPWPFVQLGDSTSVGLGDWCLALGYPLSFKRGKPAAVRIGRILEKSSSRFFADCPIMGGDSGGPLFNLNGELVGISSRIKSDVTQNIFVPIERYQAEWHQLSSSIDIPMKKRSHAKPYLGILGETDYDRVRIRQVYQGSPAAQAGLLENDVIVSFGGQLIENFDDVANVLKSRKPGEEVVAQLNRYGTVLTLSVRLGSADGR